MTTAAASAHSAAAASCQAMAVLVPAAATLAVAPLEASEALVRMLTGHRPAAALCLLLQVSCLLVALLALVLVLYPAAVAVAVIGTVRHWPCSSSWRL